MEPDIINSKSFSLIGYEQNSFINDDYVKKLKKSLPNERDSSVLFSICKCNINEIKNKKSLTNYEELIGYSSAKNGEVANGLVQRDIIGGSFIKYRTINDPKTIDKAVKEIFQKVLPDSIYEVEERDFIEYFNEKEYFNTQNQHQSQINIKIFFDYTMIKKYYLNGKSHPDNKTEIDLLIPVKIKSKTGFQRGPERFAA